MKHAIYPERQGTITADSEDGAYPATNLANDYRKKVWKAVNAVQAATLTVPITASSASLGALAVYNTNATSGEITIEDDVTNDKVLDAVSWTIDQDRYWQEYTPTGNALTAALQLTTTETTVEAGILRAGDVETMAGPKYGSVSETLTDFSIKKQLRNGALYTKKLEMVRRFGWSCMMDRETNFRDLITLYEFFGPDPFAMLITDNFDSVDDIWTVFGSFDGVPSASHVDNTYSNVSISILEAV